MKFSEYQEAARSTAIYRGKGYDLVYPVLGLAGESGEVAEKMKKCIRDHNGEMDESMRIALKKELGDVLWYVANISSELGFDLDDVAKENVAKLASRRDRGVLHGNGDDR